MLLVGACIMQTDLLLLIRPGIIWPNGSPFLFVPPAIGFHWFSLSKSPSKWFRLVTSDESEIWRVCPSLSFNNSLQSERKVRLNYVCTRWMKHTKEVFKTAKVPVSLKKTPKIGESSLLWSKTRSKWIAILHRVWERNQGAAIGDNLILAEVEIEQTAN